MDEMKVLLVDDEEEFAESLKERLEIRDLKTQVAFDGEQALAMVEKDEPNVIVLDLRMPGLDGIEVLRKLKKDHPRVQVVILTGHGTDQDEEESRKLGAFAFLQKPVELDTLVETLKQGFTKFRRVLNDVDAALMASSLAMAGEVEAAQDLMRQQRDKGKNEGEG